MNDVGLVHFFPIQPEILVHNLDAVARDADHPLDVVFPRIHGEFEDDDVSPLHRRVGQQMAAERTLGRVSQFVHDHVVADQHGILHRTGWYDKGLQQGCGAEKEQQDGNRPLSHETADALREIGFRLDLFAGLRPAVGRAILNQGLGGFAARLFRHGMPLRQF